MFLNRRRADESTSDHPPYEMNRELLPIEHGAPIRLRVETQLGFRMVKRMCAVEVVEDYSQIGKRQGGWCEDNQYYGTGADIQ